MEENFQSGSYRQSDRYLDYDVQRSQHGSTAPPIDVPQMTYGFNYPSRNQPLLAGFDAPSGAEAVGSTSEANQSAPRPRTASQTPRPTRSKYGSLDWNRHKETFRRLYLDENKSLPEIMLIMKQEHSFDASQKLYKDKFKMWGWNKNLPIAHAYFMADKAKKRKRQEGKDTVFEFGGQRWTQERAESTVVRYSMRTKKVRPEEVVEDGPTPMGISYRTPKEYDVPTPKPDQELESVEEQGTASRENTAVAAGLSSRAFHDRNRQLSPGNTSPSPSNCTSAEDMSDDELFEAPAESISLRWKGRDRSDLHALERSAKARLGQRDWVTAETLFRQSWEGLSHVLGSTHEDTVKVACNLAEMLVENKHMDKADAVLETTISDHVRRLGFDHMKTQAHLLYCVELLNGWDRAEDAGGLLALALSCKEGYCAKHTLQEPIPPRNRRVQRTLATAANTGRRELTLSHIFDVLGRNPTPADLDNGLRMARVHVAVKDASVEGLLKAFIKQCQKDPGRFVIQHFRAGSELLNYYEKTAQIAQHRTEFFEAKVAFEMNFKLYSSFEWVATNFACVEILEAGLQLAASFYKSGYYVEAGEMFRSARDRCFATFGPDHETTIWTLISIGMIYQKYAESWDEADEWFQQALSGALGNMSWGREDGITLSLHRALETRHFSYVTDEGRPFKSIFGLTGVTIRPGRLHLG